jgi:hypothetical protein
MRPARHVLLLPGLVFTAMADPLLVHGSMRLARWHDQGCTNAVCHVRKP